MRGWGSHVGDHCRSRSGIGHKTASVDHRHRFRTSPEDFGKEVLTCFTAIGRVEVRCAMVVAFRSRNWTRSFTPPPGLLAALLSFRPFTLSHARPGSVLWPRFGMEAREAKGLFPLRCRARASVCFAGSLGAAVDDRVDLVGFVLFVSPAAGRFARRPSPSISMSPSTSTLGPACFRFWMPPRLGGRVLALFRVARVPPPRGPRGGAIITVPETPWKASAREWTVVSVVLGRDFRDRVCEGGWV